MQPERQGTLVVSLECSLGWSTPKRWFWRPLKACETPRCVHVLQKGDGCSWHCTICPWGQDCLPTRMVLGVGHHHLHPPVSALLCFLAVEKAVVLLARLCPSSGYLQAPSGAQKQCSSSFLSLQRCRLWWPSLHILNPGTLPPPHGNQTSRPLCPVCPRNQSTHLHSAALQEL